MPVPRTRALRARLAGIALLMATFAVAVASAGPGVRGAGPTLTILSPADHAVIGNGTPVTVVFVVSDFNLTPPGSGAAGPTPREGYVDVYVNGNLTASVAQETVVLPLPSGVYTVMLRLVLANGTTPNPDVVSSVTVTVTQGPSAGSPRIDITYVEIEYPTPGVVLNDDVTISFRVTDFALVPPGKTAAVPNEGHVAVYLDGTYYQAVSTFDPVFFSDLTDGDHNVTMQLVDSSGHPLTPDASSAVTFRIQSSPVVDITPYLLYGQIVLAIAIIVVLFYRGRGLGALAARAPRTGRRKG